MIRDGVFLISYIYLTWCLWDFADNNGEDKKIQWVDTQFFLKFGYFEFLFYSLKSVLYCS